MVFKSLILFIQATCYANTDESEKHYGNETFMFSIQKKKGLIYFIYVFPVSVKKYWHTSETL